MDKENEATTQSIIFRAAHKLVQNLEDMTSLYRQLLSFVRKEKELLLKADMEELHLNTEGKEQVLQKIRLADTLRQKHAEELAVLLKADVSHPRLMELAQKLPAEAQAPYADKMRQIHSTLDILIKRVVQLNKENEDHTRSALSQIKGALNNVKETLGGKRVYAKKGQLKVGPEQAGNFVSKEA